MRSKLRPPELPRESVPRPHLLDELRSGRSSALTLVCAPPGYGKTTLLSQWAEAGAGTTRFTWVTLDKGDADPVRFWTYLVSALSTVAASAGRHSLPALSRHPERMMTEALPLLMEELEEGHQDLVLVLEDYHRADCPPVTQPLAFFIERRPERLQVVLSARSDPQLPLGRWRANGQLTEIRADQLQFTEREVGEFFDRTGIGDLSRAELGKLTVRTALILLADCRYHAGDAARAREVLEEATDALDQIPGPGIVPELAASVRGRLPAPGRRAAAYGQDLSEREFVVLRLLATGLSQREIATQLYVSPNTVKTHVRATYRKLGAGTRAQALHRARDLGLLPRSPG